MTALDTLSGPAGSIGPLPSELIDGIAEAVASRPDLDSRSQVVCSLVNEIFETVKWVHGADRQQDEVASLAQVMQAAQEHQLRMRATS
jgi:hypothetical protein